MIVELVCEILILVMAAWFVFCFWADIAEGGASKTNAIIIMVVLGLVALTLIGSGAVDKIIDAISRIGPQ